MVSLSSVGAGGKGLRVSVIPLASSTRGKNKEGRKIKERPIKGEKLTCVNRLGEGKNQVRKKPSNGENNF